MITDGRIAVVERLDQDDLVARIDQRLHRGKDAFGGADGDDDLLSAGPVPAKERAIDLGQRVDQPRVAGAAGVLVEIRDDGFLGGGFDEVRRRKIGEALAQIDGVVFDGQGVNSAKTVWPKPCTRGRHKG